MSGALNLEADGPATIVGPSPAAAAPDPPAAVPPAEPAPPVQAADEDVDPPDAVVDASGRKLVPLDALKATRAELKAAKQLVGQVDQLREAAARGEQLQGFFGQISPLLDKLKARPDIVANIMQQPAAPPAQPGGYGAPPDPGEAILPKQDAEDLARTLELYTPEGQPDLNRARKVALMMRGASRQEALAATAPLSQTLAASQASALQQQYSQVRDKAGRAVNPQVLQQIWNIVPPELIAKDPAVAGILYYAARGYSAHHGLDEPVPAPRAPVVSEGPGGRPVAQPSNLSDLDRAMQRAAQISEKQYGEQAAKYRPNAINVLE
jgi:hypothetical protein